MISGLFIKKSITLISFITVVFLIFSVLTLNAQNNEVIKTNTIRLSDKIMINAVTAIDIDKNNQIVLCDLRGKKVFLADKNGNLIKEIEPSKCDPGIKWDPINVFFKEDGKIVVITLFHGGFLFSSKGVCEKKIFTNSSNNKYMASYLSACYLCPVVKYTSMDIMLLDENGTEKRKIFSVKPEYPNIMYRNGIGGVTSDSKGNIYYSEKYVPKIFKYTKDGKYCTSFFKKPPYYISISKDIPAKFDDNTTKNMIMQLKDATQVIGLECLNDDKLLFQAWSNGKPYIQILDSDGNYLLPEYICLEKHIRKVKYNYLLAVKDAEVDKKGKIVNPEILVYTVDFKKLKKQ